MNAHLCAAMPNVEILEYDAEDVPWKMDLLTRAVPDRGRRAGRARPTRLGTAIDEEVVRAAPAAGRPADLSGR